MSAPAPIRPEALSGRIESLDILRGAALVGVFIVHGTQMFCGWSVLPPEQQAALPWPGLNWLTQQAVSLLFSNKSRLLFAFMFGVSFHLQLQSAERQHQPIRPLFLRRLAVLLLLGLLHAHVLFGAEILRCYALSGLLLLVARHWSSRRLLLTGAALTLLAPYCADVLSQIMGPWATPPDWRTVVAAHRSPHPGDFVWIESLMARQLYKWPVLLDYVAPVAGTFLFGMWMARQQYLRRVEPHAARLRRWAWWGLWLGLLGQCLVVASEMLPTSWSVPVKLTLFLTLLPVVYVGNYALALCYLCTLLLLCTRPVWHARLAVLAPAGRMTLTNYVLQSILGALCFSGWGLGLFARVGSFLALSLTLVLCVCQLAASAWWLRRFQMGPLEWLWRWLIRGQRPTFRREASR